MSKSLKTFIIAFVLISLKLSGCKKERFGLPPGGSIIIGFVDTSHAIKRFGSLLDSVRNNYDIPYEGDIFRITSTSREYNVSMAHLVQTFNDDLEWVFPFYVLSIATVEPEEDFGYHNVPGYEWFIDWPDGVTDTLFADFYIDNFGPNDCNCATPIEVLRLNGNTHVSTAKIIGGYQVHIFDP
ncbi:MAG: hypothetical protein JXR19_06635 [Bacteroidia bacterium]